MHGSTGSDHERGEIGDLVRRLANRPVRERDVTIRGLVDSIASDARRRHRRLGELVEAWEALVPPDLARQTRLDALRSGCLHVTAASAPVSWSVDRLLRSGLLESLRERCRGAVVRVKVSVGQLDADS